ncbi:uncharacterized protein LOC144006147 [Festucalex cinctus]
MKAPAIRPLLFGIIILRALMCEAQNNSTSDLRTPKENASVSAISPGQSSRAVTTQLTSAVGSTSKSNPSPDSTPSSTASPVGVSDTSNKCIALVMLTGGLILVCFVLLLSTLMLTCKVCQMSKRIGMLASEPAKRTESDGKYKSNSETEAKENSMLLTDLSQTQEQVDHRGPEEESVKVRENGEKGEGKEKEAAESEEAADVTPVDDSTCLTQQKDGEAPSPDGNEEQKHLV